MAQEMAREQAEKEEERKQASETAEETAARHAAEKKRKAQGGAMNAGAIMGLGALINASNAGKPGGAGADVSSSDIDPSDEARAAPKLEHKIAVKRKKRRRPKAAKPAFQAMEVSADLAPDKLLKAKEEEAKNRAEDAKNAKQATKGSRKKATGGKKKTKVSKKKSLFQKKTGSSKKKSLFQKKKVPAGEAPVEKAISESVKEGWMSKRGAVNKSWKNRYWTLVGSTLSYFHDYETAAAKKKAGGKSLSARNTNNTHHLTHST